MSIEAARQNLRNDLAPLGYPLYNGPTDRSPSSYPAIVILPPEQGAWVQPGRTFATVRYNFDVLFMTAGDDTDECREQIEKFIIEMMNLKSSWTQGIRVDSPFQVIQGASTYYEVLIHVTEERAE